MQVNMHEAKSQLSKLVEAARNGEEVILAKDNVPVAQIVPIPKSGFKLGILKGVLTGPIPDFLEPMSAEDLRLWEGGD